MLHDEKTDHHDVIDEDEVEIPVLSRLHSEPTVLEFQVPREGMPILPYWKNEVSSSVSQFFGITAPWSMFRDINRANASIQRRNQLRTKSKKQSLQLAMEKELDLARRPTLFTSQHDSPPPEEEVIDLQRWGKNTVIMQMILEAAKGSASFRGGVKLPFVVSKQIARNAQQEQQIVPNNNQFIIYTLANPLKAFFLFFFYPKTRLRGAEDSLQVLMMFLVTPLTVIPELLLKLIGASLTQPFRKVWLGLLNKKTKHRKRAAYGFFGICILPLWGLGQGFFICGNTLGYSRRIIDALLNIISILCASCFGNRHKYPELVSCLGLLTINSIQLFTAYVGLTSLLLLIPEIELFYPMALLALPLTESMLAAIPDAVENVFTAIVEPLTDTLSTKSAEAIGGLTTFAVVGTFLQMAQGLTETILMKIRNGSFLNSLNHCTNWVKTQLRRGRKNSLPDLEIAEDVIMPPSIDDENIPPPSHSASSGSTSTDTSLPTLRRRTSGTLLQTLTTELTPRSPPRTKSHRNISDTPSYVIDQSHQETPTDDAPPPLEKESSRRAEFK